MNIGDVKKCYEAYLKKVSDIGNVSMVLKQIHHDTFNERNPKLANNGANVSDALLTDVENIDCDFGRCKERADQQTYDEMFKKHPSTGQPNGNPNLKTIAIPKNTFTKIQAQVEKYIADNIKRINASSTQISPPLLEELSEII